MIISSKGRYALRVMVDLALIEPDRLVPLKEIAERQDISLKYLESIMTNLSKSNLVESASGKGGGYRLTRAPKDYSVREIFCSVEGEINPVSCNGLSDNNCEHSSCCYTLPFWTDLEETINDYLGEHTLYDVINMHEKALNA